VRGFLARDRIGGSGVGSEGRGCPLRYLMTLTCRLSGIAIMLVGILEAYRAWSREEREIVGRGIPRQVSQRAYASIA